MDPLTQPNEPSPPAQPPIAPQPNMPPVQILGNTVEQPTDIAHQPAVIQPPILTQQLAPPPQPINSTQGLEFTSPQPIMPAQSVPYELPLAAVPRKRNGRKLIIILITVALVAAAGAFSYFKFFKGMQLATFENDNLSVLIPAEYEPSAITSGFQFTEADGNPVTRSFVIALSKKYDAPVTDEKKKEIVQTYEKQAAALINDLIGSDQLKVEQVTGEKTIRDDQDAVRIKADLSKDNKKAKLEMVIIVRNDGLYVAGVVAHDEDADIVKLSDVIVNSLTTY